jgi:hypothetical protein
MSNKLCKRVISGSKEEEILMREVMGSLEEIATMLSYNPWPGDFEIIAIYPPNEENDQAPHEETVVKSQPEPARPKADIISYQKQKERLLKYA